jgi:polyhydroxyalkanoate synthesis regulator protein
MSNVTNRKYKELESRLETIEKWLKEKTDDLDRLNMLENYSFLIKALKEYVDRQEQLGQQMQHMQGQFQTNIASVEEFMKENDMEDKWTEFIEKKQKEAEEAAKKQQDMNEGPEIKSASEIIAEQRGIGKAE